VNEAEERFMASLAEQPDRSIAEELVHLAGEISGQRWFEKKIGTDAWPLILRDAARRLS